MDTSKLVERFTSYINVETQSDENSTTCPSTKGQLALGAKLKAELEALGLEEVKQDENGYITATLPANGCPNAPTVGFISHLDTAPDAPGAPMEPRIVKEYDGSAIVLNAENNIVLSPEGFPELLNYKGQDLMVTNGITLLGSDDKAGVCAIVSAAEYLKAHPEIKHGTVKLGFTPDEEIGRSSNKFDVAGFKADFAYTVDGGKLGSIEFETFNAANALVHIKGRNIHTGSAKGKMVNAITIAAEYQMLLPGGESPEYTSGHEGFYHVHKLNGSVDSVDMTVYIRDHDRAKYEHRRATLEAIMNMLNTKYGEGTVTMDLKVKYYNMREMIEPCMYIIDIAKEAMEEIGVTPICEPIRGGTDGARLSFKGLPCPNIFTGGHNFHGIYEYLPIPSLVKASETVVSIIKKVATVELPSK